jgi:hypothetical protein
MRRGLGVFQVSALIAVLWPGIAFAAAQPALTAPPSIGHALFQTLFGETGDRSASFLAVSGDGDSESPLRSLAFRVEPIVPAIQETADTVDHVVAASGYNLPLAGAGSAFAYSAGVTLPTVSTSALDQVGVESSGSPLIGYYQGVLPVPSAAPATRSFDLGSVSVSAPGSLTFGSVLTPQSNFDPHVDGASLRLATGATVAVPVQIGRVHMTTHADAAQAEQPTLALTDQAVGGGATFDVRAGRRNLGLDLSSRYERFTLNQPVSGSSFEASSAVGLTDGNLPVFVPAYADVNKRTYSAGVLVPISQRLNASLQYDTQRLLGGYGVPGIANLNATNDIYGARFTYQLPRSESISLTAKQFRYQDNLIPTNAFTQTSANVDFTVKF